MNESMFGIFRDKLKKKKEKINKLLKVNKKDRNKHYLKLLLKEANQLKKLLKTSTKKEVICCPHCQKEIELDK